MISGLEQQQQQGNLIDMDEDTPSNTGENQQQSKTQILIEDDYNIQQLQERERAIRQLEVMNEMVSGHAQIYMYKNYVSP